MPPDARARDPTAACFESLAIPPAVGTITAGATDAVLPRGLTPTQTMSASDHNRRGFGCHAGVGVQHAKPVSTRLPQLDIGGELARLIGFRG